MNEQAPKKHENIYTTKTVTYIDPGRKKTPGKNVAFVPTMGNLHEGHLQLIRKAKNLADCVVVSIFVNPLQFGANEDLDNYPRTLAADKEKLFTEGVNYLYTPSISDIYPEGMDKETKITVPELSNVLCGASRPGHFTGVATIVAKLFQIVQPDYAIFGKKDFQQLAVIKKMASDLCMPTKVIGIDTARDHRGLALSSRNGFLNNKQLNIAPALHQTLRECREAIACGYDSYKELELYATESLNEAGFKPEYFSICDAKTLKRVTPDSEKIVILVAAKLGNTRLIDNITLTLNPSQDWGMLATN